MQKSFKQRLAALEVLEAAERDRVLCVWLHIRPADYAVMLGDDDAAALAQEHAYGLDQIPAGARVNVWGAYDGMVATAEWLL
jgi:hypothetical protein